MLPPRKSTREASRPALSKTAGSTIASAMLPAGKTASSIVTAMLPAPRQLDPRLPGHTVAASTADSAAKSLRRRLGDLGDFQSVASHALPPRKAKQAAPGKNDFAAFQKVWSKPDKEDCKQRRKKTALGKSASANKRTCRSSKGSNVKTAKKQIFIPQEWKCPICPNFSTGVTQWWAQKKATHIRTWHKDDQPIWARKHCTLQVPPPGQTAEWQCKFCPLAIVGMAASSKPGKTARFNHWKKEHADKPRKDFMMPKGAQLEEVKQGNIRKSNGLLAKRLLQVTMSGKHAPTQVFYDTGTRPVRSLVCSLCKRLGKTAAALTKQPCEEVQVGTRGFQFRVWLLRRLRCRLAVQKDPVDRERLTKLLETLTPSTMAD